MPFSVLERPVAASRASQAPPRSSGFRVLQSGSQTPSLAAFLVGAGRELASPVRAIKGLFGIEPSERDVEREGFASQLAEEHPVATGLGTAAGFVPSLVVGG